MTNQQTTNKNQLLLIKTLLDKNITISDFMEQLGVKKSAMNKYLKEIKEAGFKIRRKNDNLELFSYSQQEKLEKFELNVLAYLLLISHLGLSRKDVKENISSIEKMIKMSYKQDHKELEELFSESKKMIISKYYDDKIEIIKNYLNGNRRIILSTKDKKELSIIPMEFFWKNEKMYLKFQDDNDLINTIELNSVVKINEDSETLCLNKARDTIFEIRDKLAKTYLLRNEERVLDVYKDKIVIANSSPNKDKLFKRLLRYDKYCKVTYPKKDVEKFKKIIAKSLANIDEFLDNIE